MIRGVSLVAFLLTLAASPARAENFLSGFFGELDEIWQVPGQYLDEILADVLGGLYMEVPPTAPDVGASRIFSGPDQYPPADFAAYGIVVFKSRATPFDIDRYKLICEAYLSAIPHHSELDIPLSDQMVTVWPVDTRSHADAINRAARSGVCDLAVANYGLVTSLDALADAQLAGASFSGTGPYLLAWSPAKTKGSGEALVLQADLSHVSTIAQAKSVFEKWVVDIEENPQLWQKGWNVELVRISIRNWLDQFGGDVLKIFG